MYMNCWRKGKGVWAGNMARWVLKDEVSFAVYMAVSMKQSMNCSEQHDSFYPYVVQKR